MEKINPTQKIQESEYSFPYHYIPEFDTQFSLSKSWSWGMQYISAIEFILNKISNIDFNSVGDVGTGDGRLVRELAKKFPNKEITGIDYSERAINLAKALNPNLNFKNVNILDNSYDKKYDLITLIEVFEHIPIQLCDSFIQALSNLLEIDGILILTVPHSNKKLNSKHFQHFTSQKIRQYFSKYFEFEEIIFFEDNRRSVLKKIINMLVYNNFFVLNNKPLLNFFYSIYKEKYFLSDEKNCGRIFVKMRRI